MKIRRKQREKRTHAVKWLLLVALFAGCFVAYQGVQDVLGLIDEWTADVPTLENTDAFNFAQESAMYASDGTTLLADFQLEKRNPVTHDQISPYALHATVDTEDVRFFEHNGVDLAGIARAVVNNFVGGDLEGASTITQQLVRNTVLSEEMDEISLKRKVREAQLALNLEKLYSKDEILTMYLNTINYGDGCYGIEAAARNYFQTTAANLTIAQAATLAGIPQSPTYLDPKKNPEACLERRNVVLSRMLSAGDITQEEYDAAVALDLGLNVAPDDPEQGIYAYPYFTSYVRSLLLDENNAFGISHADLFEGGLTIYTTLDTAMQDDAEAACEAQYNRMGNDLEASLVAIDSATGYIKALVGGKNFYDDQWNIATQGGRPVGSSFKAFTLATAIEQGISPQTLIDCTNPLTMSNGEELYNFGEHDYGIRSIESATTVSSNTGYYRLIEQVTPAATIDMAQRLGVTSKLSNLPIITLGTENITPLVMANAYATFSSGGVHRDSVAITKIVDKEGTVIYETQDTAKQVISEEVAGAVTKTLRTVFESSDGTASDARLSSGQPVAGKTGTGVEFRDHWLVGYTPSLSCSVWIGDRYYNSTDENLTANALWSDFMNRVTAGKDIEEFPSTAEPSYTNEFNTSQASKYANATASTKDPASAPSVVGMTLTQAASALSSYNVWYIESRSDTLAAGTVISQSVSGQQLILNVSSGTNGNSTNTATSITSSTTTNGTTQTTTSQ